MMSGQLLADVKPAGPAPDRTFAERSALVRQQFTPGRSLVKRDGHHGPVGLGQSNLDSIAAGKGTNAFYANPATSQNL
ncbi:unnamed protein product [Caretta caretta]